MGIEIHKNRALCRLSKCYEIMDILNRYYLETGRSGPLHGSPFIIASSIGHAKEFKDSKYSIHFIFICILPTIKWRKIYLNMCFNILYQMIYCQ